MAQPSYRLTKTSVNFTRPATVTAYSVGQVVSNGSFLLIPSPDRPAYIRRLLLVANGMTTSQNIRIHLFSQDPSAILTTVADQSALAIPTGVLPYFEGYFDITTGVTAGLASGSVTQALLQNTAIPYSATGVFYALCSSLSAVTPNASTNYRFDFYFETAN